MTNRHGSESDPTDDERETADEAEAEEPVAEEEFNIAEALSGRSSVAEPVEPADADPEEDTPLEDALIEVKESNAEAAAEPDHMMQPVAVERGIPAINDLKQRLGSWLNK